MIGRAGRSVASTAVTGTATNPAGPTAISDGLERAAGHSLIGASRELSATVGNWDAVTSKPPLDLQSRTAQRVQTGKLATHANVDTGPWVLGGGVATRHSAAYADTSACRRPAKMARGDTRR